MALQQVTAKYNSPCLSGDDMILEVFSNAALSTTNLRFVIVITFPSPTGINPITIYADPTADPTNTFTSYAQFNLSEYITKALKGQIHLLTDFPYTTLSASYAAHTPSKLYTTFIVAASEYSGSTPALVNTITQASNKVILGGTDYASLYTTSWFNVFFTANKNFLTWLPTSKKTYSDQAEFLSFLAPISGTQNYAVKTVAQKLDGNVVTINNIFGTASLSQYSMRRYNVGMASIKAAQPTFPAAADLDFYTIEVTSSSPASEVRTFYNDQEYQPYRKKLVWLNSLGGFDSFSFTGKAGHSSELADIKVNQHHHFDYDLNNQLLRGQRRSTERKEQKVLKIFTGYQSKATVDALRDLLLSEYLFEDYLGHLIPIEPMAETYKIYDDGQDNWSMEMTLKYLFTNKYYTPWNKFS